MSFQHTSFARKIGQDGLSAYEIAVRNGFVGTESEWLVSLKIIDSVYEPIVEIAKALPRKAEFNKAEDELYSALRQKQTISIRRITKELP